MTARRPWLPEEDLLLRQLVEKRESYSVISQKMGRTFGSVGKRVQVLGLKKPRSDRPPWDDQEQRLAMTLTFNDFKKLYPERTYDGYHSTRVRIGRNVAGLELVDYTKLIEEVEGDAVVCACVHVPQTDPEMWFRALAVGQRDGIENLIIAGDIVTGDMFSKWDTKEVWDFDKELESLARHLEEALGIFKYVYITPGNHVSNRIVRLTNGHIRLKHLIDMAGVSDVLRERILTTDIDFLKLHSGDETFLIGHATGYSNIDGRISMFYAEKEECHVITGNGHRFGQQATKSGKWYAWDIGTMADPKYMGYANSALTKFPKMLQSFCTVRNGTVKMYAAGAPVTDWVAELR